MTPFRFYLGTHRPRWLWDLHDVPLFISHRVLRERKTRFPRATTPWALDSGGFSELSLHHEWRTTPEEYVEAVQRYDEELGHMEWASPQDWMCEPVMLLKTGFTVSEHQKRTTENYLHLTDLAPDLGFIPVLQGWELDDYVRHVADYEAAGVDLASLPLVGVGSVCRRQHASEIGEIMGELSRGGFRLHGYGVKSAGLQKYATHLASADSLAWSFGARQRTSYSELCGKRNCANCQHYALSWRESTLAKIAP